MMPVDITIFNITIPLYYVGYILAFPACVAFNATYYRKCYALGNMKMIFITMFGLNMSYLTLLLLSAFLRGYVVHGFNWVRVIGFMPIMWIPAALLSKTKYRTLMDFSAPSAGISNLLAHIGCIFAGCCNGYPIEIYPSWMQWMGIYNNPQQRYLFPIQLVEVAIMLVILIMVVGWAKSKKFKTNGRTYPVYLILFAVTRFFCEFLRDNPKIVWRLSEFSFWCIGWVIVGIVWLKVLDVIDKKKAAATIEPADLDEVEAEMMLDSASGASEATD